MNSHETEKLLIEMSAVDNRLVTPPAIVAWAEILQGVDYQDAREALLEHRRDSKEYVLPAHIVANVRKRRPRTDNGIARPPAPAGQRYAQDVIEFSKELDE